MSLRDKKFLFVSSVGGHWIQMSKLIPLAGDGEASFCCTSASVFVEGENNSLIPDISRSDIWKLPYSFLISILILFKKRPDVVVSTGALPGLVMVFCAKFFGIKTVWVDSIANSEELSFSGRMALKFVDLHYCQWEDLASSTGSKYSGRIL